VTQYSAPSGRLESTAKAERITGKAMNGNPDGLQSLAKYSNLPIERIEYFPDADESVIRGIKRGILFLMAFWSGPSVMAFARITEVVSRLDKDQVVQLVVVDVDGSPAFYELPEFLGRVHGAGETAWVRNGSIVATSGLGLNIDCFVPNTVSLLAMP
jgi:hypothetical protein